MGGINRIEETHIEGIYLLNDKIYFVENEIYTDGMKGLIGALEQLISEAEMIDHSVFTRSAIQKWYPKAMYASSDKLDKLAVGETDNFGDGEEQLELTRESNNLYSGRWVLVREHIKENHNLNLNQDVKISRRKILICK